MPEKSGKACAKLEKQETERHRLDMEPSSVVEFWSEDCRILVSPNPGTTPRPPRLLQPRAPLPPTDPEGTEHAR